MVKIVPFEHSHLEQISLGERHEGESLKVSNSTNALTVLNGDKPVAIIGGHLILEGVMQAWAFISDDVSKCALSFHKSMLGIVGFYMDELKLRRIQISVRCDYLMGMKWAGRLGFIPEGCMRKYGSDGSDYLLLARVS